ncbi:hypothetical protein B0H14DRAFT_2612827 [Mycena olivaceomarginata]|nr:hypothetical protein B0H14DRAFT_2612827 [Mycena olivaceomarginata]
MTTAQVKEKERDGEVRRERTESTRSSRKERERDRGRDKEKDWDKHRERDRDRDRNREKRMSRDYNHDHRQGREREEKHHHHHDKEKTGSYTPEFLQTMAKSDGPTKAEFDVISGADAVTFARKFVSEQGASEVAVPSTLSYAPPRGTSITDPSRTDPAVDQSRKLKRRQPFKVFGLPCAAGTGLDAGRRVVDFYMSWSGKQKTHPLKGRARRSTFLDEEFRRAKEEWTRARTCGRRGREGFAPGSTKRMCFARAAQRTGRAASRMCRRLRCDEDAMLTPSSPPPQSRTQRRIWRRRESEGRAIGDDDAGADERRETGWERGRYHARRWLNMHRAGWVTGALGAARRGRAAAARSDVFSDGGESPVSRLMRTWWGKAAIPLPGHSVCVQSDSSGDVDETWRVRGDVRAARESHMSTTPRPRAPTDPQPLPHLPPMLAHHAREEHNKSREFEGGPTAPPFPRSISDPLPLPSSYPINTERRQLGTRGSMESLLSVSSLPLLGMIRGVPVGNRVPLRVTNPGDNMSMSSNSGSLAEIRNPKPTKTSPLCDSITYRVPPLQDNANVQPRHTGRTVLGSSNLSPSSSGSNKSQKSNSSRREKTLRVQDDNKILMDDQDKVAMPDDYATWHGLERRLSARSASKPSLPHDSPWLGPLVNLDKDIIYTPDHSDSHPDLYSLYYLDYSDDDSDSDSDEDMNWPLQGTGAGVGSVIPIESLLSAMGYLTPEAAVLSNTPLPYGSYTPLPATSNSSSHASYTAPHVLPRVPSSPYQLQLQSPSHACMPVGYGNRMTPPMQLLRSSPGTVYPPTAYTSPAPARYLSLYPPASPAAGYTTNPCVAASPAALYTNLAQSYSSPYVPPPQGRGYYN